LCCGSDERAARIGEVGAVKGTHGVCLVSECYIVLWWGKQMTIFNFISLFGGLALFLYGMRLMGDGLKAGSSGAMKKAMEKVANNPFVGFLLGLVVTTVIQSSTATIVLTSGLVGAGILSLHQSIGIVFGANVGTTITAQIIRLLDLDASSGSWLNLFKPSSLAPIALIIGILLIMVFHFRNSNLIGQIAMGFGILFTGLLNMTSAVSPLSESESFAEIFVTMANQPVLGFLAGTGVAFLIQSSSATIGILQALSMTGALTFSSIYAIIIGVNIGDCVTTAIVCSIGSKADAKRTGMVHILFNLVASVLIILAVTLLHHFGVLDAIWDRAITPGGIANTHTLFRLSAAIVLLPLASVFERMAKRIIKDDPQVGESVEKEIQQLDEKFYSSPALALSSAREAICAMARLARTGVMRAMGTLEKYDRQMIEKVNSNEERIDALADRVDNYLVHFSPHVATEQDNDLLNYYIQCFTEFERIGDYAVNLTESAVEIHEKDNPFSETARKELQLLEEALNEIMQYAYDAFTERDINAARHIEPVEEVVDDLVATLRNNHIRRLRQGKCTVYAGLTFLDILTNVERIADQCSNIGIYTLSMTDSEIMKDHHNYVRWLHQGGDPLFNTEYKQEHDKYFERLNALEAETETLGEN
jgi:phosphate:Na+ symporter